MHYHLKLFYIINQLKKKYNFKDNYCKNKYFYIGIDNLFCPSLIQKNKSLIIIYIFSYYRS